jgi:integrase
VPWRYLLSIDQVRAQRVSRLLRAANHHPRDFAILEVLIGTGARVGELLGLCVGDVDTGKSLPCPLARHLVYIAVALPLHA